MEPEDSALEKESDSQSNTFSSAVLQHDPDQVNIGEQSTKLIFNFNRLFYCYYSYSFGCFFSEYFG